MGRRMMIGLLLGAWLLVAGAGLLVLLGALRQAHLADERVGSHDWAEPRTTSAR